MVGKKVLRRTNSTFPTVFVLIYFANQLICRQNSIKEQSRRGVHWTPALMNVLFKHIFFDVMKIVYRNNFVTANRLYEQEK